MIWHSPWWFLALPLAAFWPWAASRTRHPHLRLPTVEGLTDAARQSRPVWARAVLLLRAATLAFVALALARPQQGLAASRIKAEGIDIVLAVDVSTSMLAEDFQAHGRRNLPRSPAAWLPLATSARAFCSIPPTIGIRSP